VKSAIWQAAFEAIGSKDVDVIGGGEHFAPFETVAVEKVLAQCTLSVPRRGEVRGTHDTDTRRRRNASDRQVAGVIADHGKYRSAFHAAAISHPPTL
jgi:hypothetical protein